MHFLNFFQQPPSSWPAGQSFDVVVEVLNSVGNRSGFTGNITVAIGTNPAGGILSGTTTVAAVSGAATFSGLSIDRAASGYTLTATVCDSTATSTAFTITPGPAAGATSTITADPTSLPADGMSTSTITVQLRDAFENALTAGGDAVTLSSTAGALGAVTDLGDGRYTAILTAPLAAATATITGTVNGTAIVSTATVEFLAAASIAIQLEFSQEPSNTRAGFPISPAVEVRAVITPGIPDPTYTGDITVTIGTGPAGGTLSGTTTVAATGGVATFPTLSIDRVGTYTLTASASGLASATSAGFAITPGPAVGATSTITAEPTSLRADGTSTSTITVQLRDAFGNALTAGGDAVVLSTTAGTLSAVTDLGDGRYTATLTAPTAAGTATITGTVNGTAIAGEATVTFTPVATRLVFSQQPSNTPAGSAIAPAVEVRAVDAAGLTDPTYSGSITVAIGTNPAGGTLSGTTTVAAVGGVATFSSLSVDRVGSGYTLTAAASDLTGAASAAFAITPGPAAGSTSTITAAPTSVPADGISTSTITVQLRDAFGNALTAGGDAVILSTTHGTLSAVTDLGNGRYTATLTATTGGTATVSGTVNGVAITSTASVTFTPRATRLVFSQQPSNTPAGSAIAPAVEVRAVDAAGVTDPGFTGSITVAIGTNPAGGTLSGTTTVAAVGGVATFSSLSINRVGTGYTLTASASGLTGATSAAFAITPGPAAGSTSTITAAPTSVPADGISTSTITVQLRDAFGNALTAGGDAVVLSSTAGTLSAVTDLGNGRYRATLRAPTTAATATITGTVNGTAIVSTATVDFVATIPVATRLVFSQQPSNTPAGSAIAPAVEVRAVDAAGLTDPTYSGSITVAIGTNPAGGTLSGTTTVAAVGGVATFSSLSINRVGTGYTLTASASGLTGATSAAFAITPGPAAGSTSTITAAPTSVPADGISTSTITVQLRDAFGNALTAGGDAVVLSSTAGTLSAVTDLGNGRYTATLRAPTTAATATITGTVNGTAIAGTATVAFTATGGGPIVATRLIFSVQPSTATAGAAIVPAVEVRAVNAAGLTDPTFNASITVTIGTNPAGGTLSGTTTVAAVGGIAIFSNLRIDRPASGYTLAASASGLASAISTAFTITAGGASGATSTITAAPTSVPADGTSTSTVTVQLRNASGAPMTVGGDDVRLTTTAGTLGPVQDQGNGTYTATLRSSTTPATAMISGTVNGQAIAGTATVQFTGVSTDLAVTASVSNATPRVGETVVLSIRVTNNGPARATGVEVTYPLSDRLALVSSQASQGAYSPSQGMWAVGTLELGANATLDITVRVVR